jgi:dCTP deaminase
VILTGDEIYNEFCKGKIYISPFNVSNLGPNSYDITLSNKLLIYHNSLLDMKKEEPVAQIVIPEDGMIIYPGTLYLGETLETTSSEDYITILEGRSSVGRLGISIHSTAGFGDLGFSGTWTLEISCVQPVKIYPNIRIGQVYFTLPKGVVDAHYNGKYQNQTGPQPSRLWEDFND